MINDNHRAQLGIIEDIGDNKANLRRLLKQIGTPQGVVPFIGAGMSIQYGFSGWTDFLTARTETASQKRKIQKRIKAGEYEEAAEDLQAFLGVRGFPDAIEDEYGNHKLDGIQISGAVSHLPKLTRGPIITTNFDHVLEKVFRQAGRPFSYVVWGAKPDIINDALQHHENILIKFHGDVKDRTDRVLTKREYDLFYGGVDNLIDFSLPLPRILRQVLTGRALLFIGCSLNQDRTISVMQQIATEVPETAHYAILEKPASDAEYQKRRLYLSNRNIRPIWYPKGQHELIEPLLAYLVENGPRFPDDKADTSKTNLPLQLNRFIGRETELQAIKKLLLNSRMLTLTGLTGFGKTRLAQQVGNDLLNDYEGGVWLVDLSRVELPNQVIEAVAYVLGVCEEADRSLIEKVITHLKSEKMLLILDNCERLAYICAKLTEKILRECADIRIMVTSQQKIGTTAEHLYPVPALSLPEFWHKDMDDDLLSYDAIGLFVERASAVLPNFIPTEQNLIDVFNICKWLDGNPLAIELAAGRVDSLTIKQILNHLNQSFVMLKSISRTSPLRHQTLTDALEWSYNLCSDMEKAFLRRVSVYAGGWTLEMAQRTIIGSNLGADNAFDILSELVGKSLITKNEQKRQPRYRMLRVIQQYCYNQLILSDELDAAASHHAEVFFDLALTAEPNLMGSKQIKWLEILDIEHDNISSSLSWLSSKSNLTSLFVQVCGALSEFWHVRGYYTEGRNWLRKAIAKFDDTVDAELQMNALIGAGNLAFIHGDIEEAKLLFEQEIALADASSNKRDKAIGLSNLSNIFNKLNDIEKAWSLLQESLTVYAEIGDTRSVAISQVSMAAMAQEAGDFGAATTLIEDSLKLFRILEDEGSVAVCLLNLGELARIRGENLLADTLFEESLELNRLLGNKKRVADVLFNRAILRYQQSQYAAAYALFEQVLKVSQELGNDDKIALALWSLGRVALRLKEYDKARDFLQESQCLYEKLDDKVGVARCLKEFGNVAGSEGEHDLAKQFFAKALKAFQNFPDRDDIAEALDGLAHVALMQGEVDRMAMLFGASESLSPPNTECLIENKANRYEAIAKALKATIGPSNFTEVWDEGRKMSREEAIFFALSGSATPQSGGGS